MWLYSVHMAHPSFALVLGLVVLLCTSSAGDEPVPPVPDLSKLKWELIKSGNREQLRQAFEMAHMNPQSAEQAGKLGMLLHASEQYEMAAACYRRARRFEPDSFRWAYYLGQAEASNGKKVQAMASLREATQIEASYLPAKLKLAELLMDSGDWAASHRLYQEMAAGQHPDAALIYYGLGRIGSARGQYSEAIHYLKKACDLFPGFGVAHYALGMLYRDQGDPSKAQEHMALFQRWKDERPVSKDILLQAIMALRSQPNDHLSRGNSLLADGNAREAISEFKKALSEDPSLAQAHGNLLSAYLSIGELARAEKHYDAAIKLDPNMCETHFNFGLLLSQQGKNEQAGEAFRKAVEINPFYAEAHNNLAFILANQNQFDSAVNHFLLAIKNRPNYRDAHFNLGQILAAQSKTREAIPHFVEAASLHDEQTPLILFTLARAHAQLGEIQQSVEWAQRAKQAASSFSQSALLADIDDFLKQHPARH